MRGIAILGSTGSIGKSSLDVISSMNEHGQDFRVTYLITNRNIDLLYQQVRAFRPLGVVVIDEGRAEQFMTYLNGEKLDVYSGRDGLMEVMKNGDFDILLSSLVGFAGLEPTLTAIHSGKTIALANKETLVVAGELVKRAAEEHNAQIIPVDSEHSAILQCFSGENRESIARLILTASGGPFLYRDKTEMETITVEEALKHPNWSMGKKITIDSATLMNKGLEVIEAHYLFGIPPEKIEIVIHPQSIIHSMVEFIDGSVKAQLGVPDMKIPIQYALSYPSRVESKYQRIDFSRITQLTFMKPDLEKFTLIKSAYEALKLGGTATAVLNGANEAAVQLFLDGKISFTSIARLVQMALENIKPIASPDLHDIFEADRAARQYVIEKSNNNFNQVKA
ncbi:MAG: 1-deoxy-D-xylulose-5-phosphate reductoisomerase [Candidatus Kryptoniota bacterium]